MTDVYDIGDKRRLQVTFTNLAGDAADPTTVAFALEDPRGLVTEYTYLADAELVRSATGIFYVDYTIVAAGAHHFRFAGAGSVTAAVEASFTARPRKTGTA